MLTLIATLLGTVVGALATLGAAVASGRFQREGAQIAARAQLQSDRRQPRNDAYVVVLDRATRLRDRVGTDLYEDTTVEEERALEETVKNMGWTELSLLGPSSVIAAASLVRSNCLEIIDQMRRTRVLSQRFLATDEEDTVAYEAAEREYSASVDQIYEVGRRLSENLTIFAVNASAALNNDGTRERRRRWRWRRPQ